MHRNTISALILIAAGSTAPALAQVHGVGGLTGSTTAANLSGGSFAYNELSCSSEATASSLSIRMNGDWSWMMPRRISNERIYSHAVVEFSVGDLPVQVDAFAFDSNAKFVNGGGSRICPDTHWFYRGAIAEKIGDVTDPNTDPLLVLLARTAEVNGNGLRIVDNLDGPIGGPILAVGRTYYLLVEVEASINIAEFGGPTPSVTVTHEFGFDLSDYRGYAAGFSWHVVPAPTSAAALTLGLLPALRRRRR